MQWKNVNAAGGSSPTAHWAVIDPHDSGVVNLRTPAGREAVATATNALKSAEIAAVTLYSREAEPEQCALIAMERQGLRVVLPRGRARDGAWRTNCYSEDQTMEAEYTLNLCANPM